MKPGPSLEHASEAEPGRSGSGADLAAVIVNYDAGHYLSRAVRSALESAGKASLELVIVDNASADGSVAEAMAAHPEVAQGMRGRPLLLRSCAAIALIVAASSCTSDSWPTARPPPSVPGVPSAPPGSLINLARGGLVHASAQSNLPARLAVDGDVGTQWNAGAEPVQWIEVDLGAGRNVEEIRLSVAQSRRGATTHVVLAKGPRSNERFIVLHTFRGKTRDGQTLSFKPGSAGRGIRVVRILTMAGPSFVAWREIEIFGVRT